MEVKPYVDEFIGSETVGLLSMMLAAVLLVLVIACVNVANLVLARAADRTREVAVRTALGARRGQVVRQTLAEVMVLAAVGALLGTAIAAVGAETFNRYIVDTTPPFWIDVRVDRTVLLFVTGITVLAALVAGLVPALRASRGDVLPLLNDEGRGTTSLKIGRLSRGLVVGEMALSFALLVVSGLVIRSIVNVTSFDPGIATREVLHRAAHAAGHRLSRRPQPHPLRDHPARTAAGRSRRGAAGDQHHQSAVGGRDGVVLPGPVVPGRAGLSRARRCSSVRRLLRGDARRAAPGPGVHAGRRRRRAQGRDRQRGRSQRRTIPTARSAARCARLPGPPPSGTPSSGWCRTSRTSISDRSMMQHVYLPLAQRPNASVNLWSAPQGDPLALSGTVRRIVPTSTATCRSTTSPRCRSTIDDASWGWRIFGTLFSVFGVAALFLATVGLYGVMAFSVSRRTQEIGVRMAVGAGAADVLRMVLRQGAWQVGLGIVAGLGVAVALSNAMRLMFYQVSPFDSLTFVAVGVLLLATGLAAAFVPARRAARVDPMAALRVQ